jgi:hypothetical protein
MSRIPLWVMVLPLALGLSLYWLFWRGEANDFRQVVEKAIPDAGPVEIGGFPYRIEARLPHLTLRRQHDDSFAELTTGRIEIDRQPWMADHLVIAAESPRLQMTLPGIAGARLDVEALGGLASIRRSKDVLQRLSMHFPKAKVWLPIVGGPFSAENFEIHVRETPEAATDSKSPTFPVQAEAKIAGLLAGEDGLRFRIDVPIDLTASERIDSVTAWRNGGTAEIDGARLLAPDGTAVAGMDATLALLPDGRLAVSGTIETDCPATVRALFAGEAPGTEFRSRRTQTLPISGIVGDGLEIGEAAGPTGGPARSQEPPCPDLRR